eukprot:1375541-Alexandrium_andersonii.AAC.1
MLRQFLALSGRLMWSAKPFDPGIVFELGPGCFLILKSCLVVVASVRSQASEENNGVTAVCGVLQ